MCLLQRHTEELMDMLWEALEARLIAHESVYVDKQQGSLAMMA